MALGVSPHAIALAKHVSPEGCQLVVERNLLEKGVRLVLSLAGCPRVTGTVRWVVEDRAGFAFDAPIAADLMGVMRLGAQGPGLELRRA